MPIKVEPHGNAKHSVRSYIRTQHSTMEAVKENLKSMTPKAAIKSVYDGAGGIMDSNSLSEIPWDRRQAYKC